MLSEVFFICESRCYISWTAIGVPRLEVQCFRNLSLHLKGPQFLWEKKKTSLCGFMYRKWCVPNTRWPDHFDLHGILAEKQSSSLTSSWWFLSLLFKSRASFLSRGAYLLLCISSTSRGHPEGCRQPNTTRVCVGLAIEQNISTWF